MKKYNTSAIVLKHIVYKDSHRIYTLLTKDYGKISAVARGVRKISSKRSGNLDTLNYINVKISENSNGYKSIDEVKTLNSFKKIKSSLLLSKNALYISELVYRSLEEETGDNTIFNLFLKCLNFLDKTDISSKIIVAYFELNFLNLLGYKLTDGPIIKQLESGKITGLSEGDVESIDFKIKEHIYEYLGDRFKSLDL